MTPGHLVLFGDSIFDNARYVPDGKCVIEHLRDQLPPGWQASLLAVDGAVTDDVALQIRRFPADATHIAVSVGGNDALGAARTLFEPAPSGNAYLDRLAVVHEQFSAHYRDMLRQVLALGKPTALCTIYDAIPGLGAGERAGLCIFNDVIIREALHAHLPVLDLRAICDDPHDYAAMSPIEPSVIGGKKIASALERLTAEGPTPTRDIWLCGK
jgi:hypothetical protein